jgi:hypothetical protein
LTQTQDEDKMKAIGGQLSLAIAVKFHQAPKEVCANSLQGTKQPSQEPF